MHKERKNTLPNSHSFLDFKHLGIVVTHRAISSETDLCTLCVTFPSSLPGGPIVLEGFVGNLLRFEPRSTQEEVRSHRSTQQMVPLHVGNS